MNFYEISMNVKCLFLLSYCTLELISMNCLLRRPEWSHFFVNIILQIFKSRAQSMNDMHYAFFFFFFFFFFGGGGEFISRDSLVQVREHLYTMNQ